MNTERNQSGDNSHIRPWSTEDPQHSGLLGQAPPDSDWPGSAPPAGWFLPRPASARQADAAGAGPEADAPEEDVTGDWFRAPEPESGESPISWEEGMDEPEPGPEPPVAGPGTIRVPADSAAGPEPPGAGGHRPVPAARS